MPMNKDPKPNQLFSLKFPDGYNWYLENVRGHICQKFVTITNKMSILILLVM